MAEMLQNKQIRDLPVIWVRKTLTTILTWDLDKDGVAGYEDHMRMADRIVKIGELETKASDKLYKFFNEYADSGADGINTVKSLGEQLLVSWSQIKCPEAVQGWKDFFSHLFQALDFNSKGELSFDEYLIYWKAMDLDPTLARLQFDYMDRNHDGAISEDEFLQANIDYLVDTEDDGNRIYGPLVDY